MKIVIQRVVSSKVSVDQKIMGEIKNGLNILLGVSVDDDEKVAQKLVEKIINLRIFEDSNGNMNKSILETGGEVLVVSQFTLMADCRKGRRPSFARAAQPKKAKDLYQKFIKEIKNRGIHVMSGEFGANMLVEIQNNGPVTVILDTDNI